MSDISQHQTSLWEAAKPYLYTPWTITVLAPLAVAVVDPANFWTVVTFAANALMGTLPYILFAVLLIAGLKAAGAEAEIARAFQGRENKMIVLAALKPGMAPTTRPSATAGRITHQ